MAESRDAYKVLQVDPDADVDVIQAAYRRLARKFHPDLAGGTVDATTAEARMIEINTAWDQLRDPARRAAYDRQRAHRAGRRPRPGHLYGRISHLRHVSARSAPVERNGIGGAAAGATLGQRPQLRAIRGLVPG